MDKRTEGLALKAVNKARKALGRKPLKKIAKGEAMNSQTCPIANSIPEIECVDYGEVDFKSIEDANKVRKVWGEKSHIKEDYDDIFVFPPESINNFVSQYDYEN